MAAIIRQGDEFSGGLEAILLKLISFLQKDKKRNRKTEERGGKLRHTIFRGA